MICRSHWGLICCLNQLPAVIFIFITFWSTGSISFCVWLCGLCVWSHKQIRVSMCWFSYLEKWLSSNCLLQYNKKRISVVNISFIDKELYVLFSSYSYLLVGAPFHQNGEAEEGMVYIYLRSGEVGINVVTKSVFWFADKVLHTPK